MRIPSRSDRGTHHVQDQREVGKLACPRVGALKAGSVNLAACGLTVMNQE